MRLLLPHYSIPTQTNLLLLVLPLHNAQMLFVVEHFLGSFSMPLTVYFVGLPYTLPSSFLISYLDNLYIDVPPLILKTPYLVLLHISPYGACWLFLWLHLWWCHCLHYSFSSILFLSFYLYSTPHYSTRQCLKSILRKHPLFFFPPVSAVMGQVPEFLVLVT